MQLSSGIRASILQHAICARGDRRSRRAIVLRPSLYAYASLVCWEAVMIKRMIGVTAVLLAALWWLGAANAAEMKLMSAVGLKSVLDEVIPQFERASSHKITSHFDTSVALKRKIDAGDTFDLAILTSGLI